MLMDEVQNGREFLTMACFCDSNGLTAILTGMIHHLAGSLSRAYRSGLCRTGGKYPVYVCPYEWECNIKNKDNICLASSWALIDDAYEAVVNRCPDQSDFKPIGEGRV